MAVTVQGGFLRTHAGKFSNKEFKIVFFVILSTTQNCINNCCTIEVRNKQKICLRFRVIVMKQNIIAKFYLQGAWDQNLKLKMSRFTCIASFQAHHISETVFFKMVSPTVLQFMLNPTLIMRTLVK